MYFQKTILKTNYYIDKEGQMDAPLIVFFWFQNVIQLVFLKS